MDELDKNTSSLDYSLQLLFLASQVDITWNSYSYPYNFENPKKSAPKKKKNGTSKFKQNVAAILQGLKHKLSNFCIPCVSGEKNEEIVSLSSLTNGKIDSNRLNTISQTLDSGIASDEERRSESTSSEESFSSNWDDWEDEEDHINSNPTKSTEITRHFPPDHQNHSTLSTIATGRCCFRESRSAARSGKMAAAALMQGVLSIQENLRCVLDEIYCIESRLNDYKWEIVDRESWIEGHLWSSVPRHSSGLANEISFNSRKSKSPSLVSGSSLALNDDDYYCWD